MSFKDYTPKAISDIVFANNHDEQLLVDIVNGNRPFPASGKNGILLYGVNGTGKSALAKLLPDAIEAVKTGNLADAKVVRVQHGNNGAALIQQLQAQSWTVPISASHHYFVLDEVDLLKGQFMDQLKSVMNTGTSIFVMTTNHYTEIEMGVRDRCHCIPFNAAPSASWLPLAKRMLADADIHNITDAAMIAVINTCNGSARNIVDAIVGVILTRRKNTASQPQIATSPSVM